MCEGEKRLTAQTGFPMQSLTIFSVYSGVEKRNLRNNISVSSYRG